MTVTQAPLRRIDVGSLVPVRGLWTIHGLPIEVPDPKFLTHLQFRRFAGCPVCNLHLRSIVAGRRRIEEAGVREVILFHSTGRELRKYAADLPLTVVADPLKTLYREFGVEAAPRALLTPRAWWPILKGVGNSLVGIVTQGRRMPSLFPKGGRTGLPADFLIGPEGRVLAAKFGEHVYDQWSVEEICALADRIRSGRHEGSVG